MASGMKYRAKGKSEKISEERSQMEIVCPLNHRLNPLQKSVVFSVP